MKARTRNILILSWVLALPGSFVVTMLIVAIGQRMNLIENGEFGFIAAIGILIQTTATVVAVLLGVTIYFLTRRSRS